MSSTQAIVPEGKSGALSHKQIMTILAGLLLGMFLAALDQTIVATAMRTIADKLERPHRAGLGHHRLPDHLDGDDPAVRQALRHVRPQAVLHVRDLGLRRRLDALRHRPLDLRAGRLPRSAGRRRRWSDVAGLRHRRRHRAAARTWSLPGLLHGRLRLLQRARPGARRLPRRPVHHPRHRRLALDLLHQRADRHRRPRRGLPGAQPPAHPLAGQDRLLGRASADRRRRAAARRRREGQRVGLGLGHVAGVHHRRRRRAGAVRCGRGAAGRGRDPAAARSSATRCSASPARWASSSVRHVRRPVLDPALPADRQGRAPDQGRPAADPADGRHHRGVGDLRPDHDEDRALQDLPDHRQLLPAARRWRCSTRCRSTPRCG